MKGQKKQHEASLRRAQHVAAQLAYNDDTISIVSVQDREDRFTIVIKAPDYGMIECDITVEEMAKYNMYRLTSLLRTRLYQAEDEMETNPDAYGYDYGE